MAGGHRPTITDVTDPVKLERAFRLLFDEVDSVRGIIRKLGDKALDTGTPASGTGKPTGGPPTSVIGGGPIRPGPGGMQQATESLQSGTGQLDEPQKARIPRLLPNQFSFEDSPTNRGHAPLYGDPVQPRVGFPGELRIDQNEQITTVGTAGTWPDYNAKTWRFDDRDSIWKPLQALGCILTGAPASFPAQNYARGTLLYHRSQETFYYCDYDPTVDPTNEHKWLYLSGTYRNTLANKPTGLTLVDTGRLFYATDFAHLYRWDGGSWSFAPGDDGSGYIGWYIQAPNTPSSGSSYQPWEVCAGVPVTISTSAATTESVTPPNFTASTVIANPFGPDVTVYGVYPLASTFYTGTNDGPYFESEEFQVASPGTRAVLQSGGVFPFYVNLIGYIRC